MKIHRTNVTNEVIDYLKSNILSGQWKVGEKIPSENQLTAELGASRSSIRAAIQHMAGIGVLESHHGKGTYLIDDRLDALEQAADKITAEDCLDIFRVLEFRSFLEPEACALAIQQHDQTVIDTLADLLQQMKTFEGSQKQFVNADVLFHETIGKASGNHLVEKSLHRVFEEHRRHHEQMNDLFGYDSGIYYHTQILEAFRREDVTYGKEMMYRHLVEARERLK